jgi:CheY-like chemotaxis protein
MQPTSHRHWPEGTTMLVVEDDQLTARLLRARLELEGLRILDAHNGEEALEVIQREEPHLVSTDLMMPAMDGYRLIRKIRELPGPLCRLPLMVLTVNQSEDEMVRCLAAGADDYVTKPISPQIFVEKLWRLFCRSRS